MILQFGPETPLLLRAAASGVLIVHISGGSVGLLSGAAALLVRKGGRLHRLAGKVFAGSMLTMAALGAIAAPLFMLALSAGISPAGVPPTFPEWANTFMGIFTLYLVCTGWAGINLKDGALRRFEIGAFLVAACAAGISSMIGVHIARSATGMIDGLHYLVAYAFGVVFGLAAIADLTVVLRGGVFGKQRIARHLWRMSTAMLIAVVSFLVGQAHIFPAAVRASGVLYLPELSVLGLMIFWMLRVAFSSQFKRTATVPART